MKNIKLNLELEKILLKAIIQGHSPISLLVAEELSKEGKVVLKALLYLVNNGATFPIRATIVLLTSITQCGADSNAIREYLKSFSQLKVTNDVLALIKAAHNKEILVNLINEAGGQLSSGNLNVNNISAIIGSNLYNTGDGTSISLGNSITRFEDPPKGISIPSLPKITEATNGLDGLWVVGGEPGLGKSSLAWQLALEVSTEDLPVLYYDLDGTGTNWLIDRTRRIVRGDIDLFRQITKQLYIRQSIRTLEEDTKDRKCFIIIDSVQTLPTKIQYRRTSLDQWIVTFKEIAKEHIVLLISEISRASYGEVRLSSYKETGELEYGGSLCAQLNGVEGEDGVVEFHITKNRHGPKKGFITNLVRDPERIFWMNEE